MGAGPSKMTEDHDLGSPQDVERERHAAGQQVTGNEARGDNNAVDLDGGEQHLSATNDKTASMASEDKEQEDEEASQEETEH